VKRVLCDGSFPLDRVRELLAGAAVVVEPGSHPWAGDDVVGILSFEPVTADDLARLPELRVVSTPSVGSDHLDVEAATKRGVWVCNVSDYCVDEMADHALALLLALVRGVVELDRNVREGSWDYEAAGPLRRIADVRLGVIGFGRIGRALAARAGALGMDVTAYDPLVSDDDVEAAGARPATLDELLGGCDAISMHAPLTAETRGLIGADELSRLPRGALVVNASRAGLVDSDALLRALESGHLAGVALDVLDVEPPSDGAPAPVASRLVVNPHAGWYSERAGALAVTRAVESVLDVLEGRPPTGAINEPVSR
jgi:D-3-phosphoglycerate dehydrogenase / 2-oxoglutarate reductase